MEGVLAREEVVRRSISLPGEIAVKVDKIAGERRVSVNRTLVDLLRDAIEAYEQRRIAFLELADRFQKATDPIESERLREELARMTFGS